MSESMPANLVAQIWEQPLQKPDAVPASADVVIIGGGIVGVSTAWFLARKGINVVLCEKGHIAGEQSGRNWGWVRQQLRDTREMPMAVESLRIWRGLEAEIGEDVGFREQGIFIAANTDEDVARYADWISISDEHDVETRLLDDAELKRYVHGAATKWKGVLYTPSDGRAEPHKAVPAIVRAAERAGATIVTGCAVRGIETEGGVASEVVTEHGTIKAPQVLCAAGAWTSMFCRSLDISVPQLKVRGTVARTAPTESVLDGALCDNHIALRRRTDGGYTVAHSTVFDHPITPSSFRFARYYLPALRMELDHMRLSLGREFVEEWRTPRKWSMDEVSPFEKTRVLDPEPNPNPDRLHCLRADARLRGTNTGRRGDEETRRKSRCARAGLRTLRQRATRGQDVANCEAAWINPTRAKRDVTPRP